MANGGELMNLEYVEWKIWNGESFVDVIKMKNEEVFVSIHSPRPSNACPWERHVITSDLEEIHPICNDSCLQIEIRIATAIMRNFPSLT